MCNNEEMFVSLDKTFTHSVKLGNNSQMMVAGKGNVKIILNGIIYGVSNVYLVPELKNNLLSVGQLQQKGLTILFKGENCTIYHSTKGEIIQAKMSTNRMFTITSEVQHCEKKEENCLQASTEELTKLWHQRYGHLSFKGLRTLQEKKMVTGMPEFKAEV
ncbi:hypothetical protein LIER_18157 [Lithospermum erythrorhizon]|uniref:GAG-pre-integrase domain-containing protein n=1 Tax=Lithospermum erythrorhizon TaxID=34254 RepID=A0AAV3QG61_LITER